MSRFGPDPHSFFSTVYDAAAPWDIGGPQPDITLAGRGHHVVGVDFIEGAITLARSRAAALPAEVAQRLEFRRADALRPSQLGLAPRSILDSGFLHLFDNAAVEGLVDDLGKALMSGGRYYVMAFAMEFPIPHGPRQVTETDVRTLFTEGRGWRLLTVRPGEFLNRVGPPVPSTCACVERL